MLWGEFKSQEVIRTVSAVAGDDPYCLDSTQFILLFLHDRTLLAGLPMLPEVGERCPAKGHCSAAMQLIQECSFVDVCSEAVTISKLPLVPLCRLEDSWLPQPAAHTSKKLGLAREWKQKGLLLRRGTQLPGSEHRTLRGPRHLTLHPAQGHSGIGGLGHHTSRAPVGPSARLHTKPALTWEKGKKLTCQVQLQRARSSSADQSQLGHHHIWSIGI